MATSRFGQRVKSTQQQLLEELVVKLLGNETTISTRRKAVGICQHRLRFNSFPDTNPDNVLIQFNDVCEILKLESRELELERLLQLKEQFFNTVLESDVLDLHSSVLRFLLSLTGDLASSKAAPAVIMKKVDPVPQQDLSISSESDLALSEWSEDSEVQCSSVISEEEPEEDSPRIINKSIPWNDYFLSKVDPPSKTGPVLGALDQGGWSLLNRLAEVQFNGPDSMKVCSLLLRSEYELVMNCLRVLQGESGTVFTWDTTNRAFHIDQHLQNHHYSAVAMRSVLSWFSRAGNLTRDLLDWSNHLLEASGRLELAAVWNYRQPMIGNQNLSPTLSACAQAIHDQVESLLSPFIQTEEALKSTQNRSKFTLIWLKNKSGHLVKNLEMLYRLHDQLRAFQKVPNQAQSVLSCAVLDTVYDWCCEQYLMGPMTGSGVFMIWRIFVESLRPFLSQLTAWLFLGDTQSISKGFLVSMEDPKKDENLNFWTDAFPIRTQSCPKFLKEVLGVLHDGGKALQMMRNQEYKNPFGDFGLMVENSKKNGRLEGLIDDLWTRDLLLQKFTDFLTTQFNPITQNQAQDPSDDDEIDFFTQMANVEKLKLLKDLKTTSLLQSKTTMTSQIKVQSQIDDDRVRLIDSKSGEGVMDEDSSLPRSYTRVLESMEEINKELHLAMDISRSQDSMLYQVLPDPVDRKPFSKLHDMIFASSKLKAKGMESDSEDCFDCLAPPPVIIKEGLLDLIQDRSLQIMRSFISCLLTDLGLMDEILVLKNIFLMGSPAINEWTRRLVAKLNDGHLISDLGEYQLILDMQECFAVCSVGEKHPVCGDNEFEDLFFDVREIDWERRFPNQEIWIERSPQELDDCGLVYPLEWPLCLLVNELKLKKYNTVFLFLMKLHWTSCAIKDVSMMTKKREGCIKEDLLQAFNNLQNWRNVYRIIHEMSHFLSSLRRYVLENIHHTFDTFQKNLLKVESIGEMQNQHDEMLDFIQRFSFQSRKKQWKTVHSRLLTLFHSILNFCSLWKHTNTKNPVKVTEVLGWMNEVVERYKEARSSTMMILHIYSYSLGGNRELNDLITMLNFNQIYVHYDPALM